MANYILLIYYSRAEGTTQSGEMFNSQIMVIKRVECGAI